MDLRLKKTTRSKINAEFADLLMSAKLTESFWMFSNSTLLKKALRASTLNYSRLLSILAQQSISGDRMHLSAKRCKVSIDKTKKFALHKSQANRVIQRIKF